MQVLVVCPRYVPHVGGVETHVRETVRRLRSSVDISVLTSVPGERSVSVRSVDGVSVREVPAYPRDRDWLVAPGVWGACRDGDADLIHFQSVATAVPPIGMLSALGAHRPFVVTFHTGGHASRLRNRLRSSQWLALRPLLRRARALVAVSEAERSLFAGALGLGVDRIQLIRNGSELPRPAQPSPYVGPDDAPVVVSVGRLERYKGHHLAVEAMPHLLREAPGARLVIVGGGPYRDALVRRVGELRLDGVVRIVSFTSSQRQELADLLGAAHVGVLLSEYEAHPVAVMEALSTGLPVLTADTSGFRELAEAGLVETIGLRARPQEVAAALARLAVGRREPAQLRSWDDCASDLLGLYEHAVGAS